MIEILSQAHGILSISQKAIPKDLQGHTMVTVAEVEEYAGQEPEPLRMALWRCKRGSDHG